MRKKVRKKSLLQEKEKENYLHTYIQLIRVHRLRRHTSLLSRHMNDIS